MYCSIPSNKSEVKFEHLDVILVCIATKVQKIIELEVVMTNKVIGCPGFSWSGIMEKRPFGWETVTLVLRL